MTDTAEKIERALSLAQSAGTPVMIDSVTLGAALDELRAARPKGKAITNLWDRGYAQGQAAEKRANAAGEQALAAKVAKVIELVGEWEEHVELDHLMDDQCVSRIAAARLREALGLGDVKIACPCGAS